MVVIDSPYLLRMCVLHRHQMFVEMVRQHLTTQQGAQQATEIKQQQQQQQQQQPKVQGTRPADLPVYGRQHILAASLVSDN
jgi:hypothetical protein